MAKGDGHIVAFRWTWKALFADPDLDADPFARYDPALQKVETRRAWKDRYARQFKEGDKIQAYDHSQRQGGKRVALLRLTRDPYQERLRDIPGNAWYREGFEWLEQGGRTVDGMTPREFWDVWRQSDEVVWVVCFELVEDCRGRGGEMTTRPVLYFDNGRWLPPGPAQMKRRMKRLGVSDIGAYVLLSCRICKVRRQPGNELNWPPNCGHCRRRHRFSEGKRYTGRKCQRCVNTPSHVNSLGEVVFCAYWELPVPEEEAEKDRLWSRSRAEWMAEQELAAKA